MSTQSFPYTAKGDVQRSADFPDAAARHLSDARLLLDRQRPDNAAYHAGYAVECAVKAGIVAEFGRGGKWHGHLHDLLVTIGGSALRLFDVHHLQSLDLCQSGSAWDPAMRYDPDGLPEARARQWVDDAQRFCSPILTKLRANGVL